MKRIGAFALALLSLSAPAAADTLIDNVNGITLDAEGRVVRFSGLLVSDEGKVIRLVTVREAPSVAAPSRKRRKGDPSAATAPQPTYRLDGRGRTMIPGMIDGHGHVMALGWRLLTLDLSAATSLEDAKARIAAYASANPGQKWIIGSGWNQETWKLGRFPTAADLDGAVADRPVWLERVDGHAGWANSAALAAAGIKAGTPTPVGGRIELASGKPTGLFVDAAMELITRHVPPPLSKERDLAFFKAQQLLLSLGITGIADMGTSVDDWMAYRRAGDRGALAVRIFGYSAGIEPMLAIAGGEPTPWLYGDRLRLGGVKLYADGALGSRGAWLKSPYADQPGWRGLQFTEDTRLQNLMSRAAMDGFQIAVHAIGDAANAQALSAFEEMNATYKGDRRWRIEHAQILDPADIPRFARAGVIASMQPVLQTSDRMMAQARLGPSRLAGAYAWNSLMSSGARLVFGSGVPVENPNPFVGLAVSMTREDADGQPFGGWQPQERILREAAFAAFTINAAWASFADTKTGRLAPGLWADFLFVDRDPFAATPAEIRSIKVLETWIGGRKVYTRQ